MFWLIKLSKFVARLCDFRCVYLIELIEAL